MSSKSDRDVIPLEYIAICITNIEINILMFPHLLDACVTAMVIVWVKFDDGVCVDFCSLWFRCLQSILKEFDEGIHDSETSESLKAAFVCWYVASWLWNVLLFIALR